KAALTVTLAVLAVLVLPLAATIARGSYQRELAEATALAAQRTAVTAVLITKAEPRPAGLSGGGVTTETTPLARRPLPHRQQRSGALRVDAEPRAGDRVPIWIDQHGNPTDPPKTHGDLIASAVVIGIVLVAGGWALLGLLWWIVCRVLGRINTTWWELRWARTGPGWTRRTWR